MTECNVDAVLQTCALVAGVPRAGHGDGPAPEARGGPRALAGGDLILKTNGGAPGRGG